MTEDKGLTRLARWAARGVEGVLNLLEQYAGAGAAFDADTVRRVEEAQQRLANLLEAQRKKGRADG